MAVADQKLDEHDARPRRGSRRPGSVGRTLVGLAVAGMGIMWGYVLFLAFGPGRQPPVDRLDDPAFAEAAEERCAEALDEVDELPLATESPTAVHRGEVVAQANTSYGTMLDDLDELTALIPEGEQRERAGRWLADWRLFLEDRQAYASALRTDPEARMLVSEKPGEGRHVTGWIDEFAAANRMPSCASPDDA